MTMRLRPLLAAAVVTVCMGFAAGVASANRLSVSNRNFRIVWNPLRFTTELATIECQVTFEGSLHSATIAKTNGLLIGYITRAAVSSCTGLVGLSVGFAAESLPWHMKYGGFTGTLPNITGLTLLIVGKRELVIQFETRRILCVYREAPGGMQGTANLSAGTITGLTFAAATTALTLLAQIDFLCPTRFGDSGTGRVTLLGNTTAITVRLI